MEIQPVGNNGQVQRFDDPDKFLEQIDTLFEVDPIVKTEFGRI